MRLNVSRIPLFIMAFHTWESVFFLSFVAVLVAVLAVRLVPPRGLEIP